MQRKEFVQQLWLDYVHIHPDLGALPLWPTSVPAEYLTLLTMNVGQYSAKATAPLLAQMGYQPVGRYAMADKGLLIHIWAPDDDSSWLIVVELQMGALPKKPRENLIALIEQRSLKRTSEDVAPFCHGRPWPMPSWSLHEELIATHPLAAWLAVMGPRLHHAGFDCQSLGQPLHTIDQQLSESGVAHGCAEQNGIFPVSGLLEHRFYPTNAQKMVFSEGDEHRVSFGGLALVQKRVEHDHEPIACLLLPHHTRCEIT
ncbi:DUF1338 domain-containing protein [Halomonas sp. LS-001]